MTLHTYLTRLIWLCILPLVILAAYLAIDSVQTTQSAMDIQAASLAKNFATAIDRRLTARIGALNILAVSPHADRPTDWNKLYQEAQGFYDSFGSHVIFADLDMRVLFNTRVPFGAPLPAMPRPTGHAAAPTALASGLPAVGDVFYGQIAKQPLIAIAVPGLRQGKVAFLLLATLDTQLFQSRLDQLVLPSGWSLALVDGNGKTIARRAPPDLNSAADVDAARRFAVKSEVSPWLVLLEIPHDVYHAPLIAAAAALAIAIFGATLTGVLGGTLASHRLAKSVASLAETPVHGASPSDILEIAAARRTLVDAGEKRLTAEAARRDSEQRFRATFDQAAVGIALVAPDGRWLQVNQRLCEIVGYSHEELLARTFQDITHPEDIDADTADARQMLAGSKANYSKEKRYLRKDGATIWINLTVALVRRADASPDYFISVIEDIQSRKETEAALKSSELTLKEAQRVAGVGNWTWVLQTDRHTWSEEIYRIYGRDPGLPPAVYPELQSYFTPDTWTRLAASVEACLARGTPYECDAEVVRADGTRRWITVRGETGRADDGKAVDLHGTVQDITERKQAEDAVRTLNAALERRVAERTGQLEAANKELEAFSYSVSHDLRAPLQTIDGFSRALLEDYGDKLDDKARHYLRRLRTASQHMAHLVDDLLKLSRLTRADMVMAPVDLGGIARSIAVELRAQKPMREVTFDIAAATVHGDKRLLAVLMQNLFSNAWKFTSKHPRAKIAFGVDEQAGEQVYYVRDDGAGFAMAHVEKLFVPFQRLHTASEFPGTGVGLATVGRIVKRHGGRIWAESALEKGTTFYFTISAAPAGKPGFA